MNIPRYLITGLLILLVIVLALSVGYWNIRPSSFTPRTTIPSAQPDFFMDNPRISQLDEQGQPVYQLISDRAEHQAGQDETHLEQPRVLYYREGEQQPWHLQARYGEVTSRGEQVALHQDVVIEQQLDGQSIRRLSTSALSIFPRRHYAETDQSVKIEANGITTATGMKAYLIDGRIELLSTVRGEHEAH